jgi:hypothetical protein
MSGTRTGAIKRAAKRMGITYEEYLSNTERGLKRCRVCHEWKALSSFVSDRSRHDGKATICLDCARV